MNNYDVNELVTYAALGLLGAGVVISVVRILQTMFAVVRGRAIHSSGLIGRIALRLLAILPAGYLVSSQPHAVVATLTPHTTEVQSIRLMTLDDGSAQTTPLLMGAAFGAGMLTRVRTARRRAERSGVETNEVMALEQKLASSGCELTVERLDMALRSLRSDSPNPWLYVITEDGAIRAESSSSIEASGSWKLVRDRVLEVPANVDNATLATHAKNDELPLLINVGHCDVGEVWINVGEIGDFAIEGDGNRANEVWTAITESCAISPFTHHALLVGDRGLLTRRTLISRDVAATTRRQSHVGESAIAIGESDEPFLGVVGLRRGLVAVHGIRVTDNGCVLLPSEVTIRPLGAASGEVESLPTTIEVQHVVESPRSKRPVRPAGLPDFSFVASVLGVPEIRHVDGTRVTFEKSKSEELVVWLALHPNSRRRAIARSALWSVPVKDSTFSNVTCDARRSLNSVELCAEDAPWVGVTMNEELPLHQLIISDIDLLRAAVEHARRWPDDGGIEKLRFGLSLVRGTPFADSAYLWSDSVGIAGDAATLVVRSAIMLAELCADSGDVDGIYWATAQGLLAIPGHEELIGTRMRLASERGDFDAVNAEWRSYCRAVASDEWGDASPSTTMVSLYRELTRRA